MKIGIYGGSFDPPHMGHVLLIHCLLMTQDFDQIVIMPTAEHPIKEHQTLMGHRIQMCHRAFSGLVPRKVLISSFENLLEKPNYTRKTLEAFVKEHPEDDLFYIIGSDLVEDIPDWEFAEGIPDLATFTVVPRQGYPISEPAPPELGDFRRVELGFQLPEISSTHIKKMLRRGGSVEGYVPKPVLDYITKKGLYE